MWLSHKRYSKRRRSWYILSSMGKGIEIQWCMEYVPKRHNTREEGVEDQIKGDDFCGVYRVQLQEHQV